MAKLKIERSNSHAFNPGMLLSEVAALSCDQTGFSAYAFRARTNVDYDGAPDSYGVNRAGSLLQTSLRPRDNLANATTPHPQFPNGPYEFCGVVSATRAYALRHNLTIDERFCATVAGADPASLNLGAADAQLGAYPVIQTSGDWAGYYVPKTNKVKHGKPWDPSIYANPLTMPLTVRTGAWRSKQMYIGDFGFAVNTDGSAADGFTFADSNHSGNVGEVSEFLNDELGFGKQSGGDVIFFGFPRSGKAGAKGENALWGVTNEAIDAGVRAQMARLANVDNRMDLVDFILAGAGLDRFLALKGGAMGTEIDFKRRKAMAARLFGPLCGLGFPIPVSDYTSFGMT